MGRMDNDNLDETRPANVGDETIPKQSDQQAPSRPVEDTQATPAANEAATVSAPGQEETGGGSSLAWRWLILISIIALIFIAIASVIGGYRSGINERTNLESTQVAQTVGEQFAQGVKDMQSGRYEVARQRFEYVIQLNPNYPGVTEKLAEVLLELNTTATPTTIPTPTLTPTVDLRGADELFTQSQMLLADHNWSEAIDTLLRLRKNEPDYQTIEVDSMLYVALRNRGVEKILNQADLEGGTYDLALAERFGPLDVEASNYRQWADLYVTGVSFWELDWAQASYYFGQLIIPAPNLRDSTGTTATERYRLATIKYADQLAEDKQWCDAQEQYAAAFNVAADPAVEPTASWVTNKCEEEQRGAEEPKEPTDTPAPEVTQAEASPTPGVAQSPAPTEASPTPQSTSAPTVESTPTQENTTVPEPTQSPSPEPTQP
jgi:tetratricopeptide (TPR) repeat protein